MGLKYPHGEETGPFLALALNAFEAFPLCKKTKWCFRQTVHLLACFEYCSDSVTAAYAIFMNYEPLAIHLQAFEVFLDHSECSAVRSQACHLISNMISHKFDVPHPTSDLQWVVSV